MNKVYVYKTTDYQHIGSIISEYFHTISERFSNIKTILIKPNLLQASEPAKGITTHPLFLKAVTENLRKTGNYRIVLGDSPGANMNYNKVLETTGIMEICKEMDVDIVRFDGTAPARRDDFIYAAIAEEADLIINLPKLKTHSLTGLTMGVKNLFGLIPGSNKVSFHRDYPDNLEFGKRIFKFYKIFHEKTVTLLDGIIAHEGDGPSKGRPKRLGLVAFSTDTIALDVAVTRILGFGETFCTTNPEGYPYEIISDHDLLFDKIKPPITMNIKIPSFLKKWVTGKVHAKPFIIQSKCIKCGLCKKSCPAGAIMFDGSFTVNKDRCIECFCCHEVCESDAIVLQRSLLHRMMIK